MNMKTYLKKESTDLLKVLGLINNVEEYHKIYHHA